MTKEQTMLALNVLKKRLKGVRIFRLVEELFSFYVIIKIFTAGTQLTLLGVNFTENKAVTLMLLLLIIDICLTMIRTNYQRSGQALIETLTDLTEQEKQFVQNFRRF